MAPRTAIALAVAALAAVPAALAGATPPKTEKYAILITVTYLERQELTTPLTGVVTGHTDRSDTERKLKWWVQDQKRAAELTRANGRFTLEAADLSGYVDEYEVSIGVDYRVLHERQPPKWTSCTRASSAALDNDRQHPIATARIELPLGRKPDYYYLPLLRGRSLWLIGGNTTTCDDGLVDKRGPTTSAAAVDGAYFLPDRTAELERLLTFPARGLRLGARYDHTNRVQRDIDIKPYFPKSSGTWTKTWTLKLNAVPCSKTKAC